MTRAFQDLRFASFAAALVVSAGCGVVGAASPTAGLALFAVVGVTTLAVLAAPRARLFGVRYADGVVAGAMLILPLAPYFSKVVPGFTGLRFALAAALAGGLLAGVIPAQRGWSRGLGVLVLAFLAFQVVPMLLAGANSYAILRFLNWVMFVPLAFVQFDRRMVRVAASAAVIVTVILLVGLLMQVGGVLPGVWGGLQIGGGAGIRPTYARRFTSFLQNPNDLALFMLMMAVLVYVGFVVTRRPWPQRVAAGALAGFCVVGLLLASSRGALLALPIAAAFLFVARQRRAVITLAGSGLVVLLVMLPLVPRLQQSVVTGLESVVAVVGGTDSSVTSRTQTWAERISSSQGGPLIGGGYGGYADIPAGAIARAEERAALYQQLTVDNGWLKLLLEEGVIGLALLGSVVVGALYLSLRHAIRRRDAVAAVCGALIVAAVFRAFSVDVFDINPWNFALWTLVGVVRSLETSSEEPST